MQQTSTASRPTAAIYARISRDAEGEALGVGRQLEDCRKLAASLGYDVADEFVDNDISASTKSRRKRPQYEEMMAMARAGRYSAIIAYSNSRLTRRVREYMDLIDLHNSHGVALRTVVSGDHNLATADGRGAALTVAVWDQAEAERTAERTARAKAQMATDGKWRGGPRPYGFEKDGVTVREGEARVIREATSAILAGRALASVARDLNSRGVRAAQGQPWTYSGLKDVLVRPRNAGLLSHGDPTRPEGGNSRRKFEIVGPATWPAIVSEETWRGLLAMLTDPSRRHQNGNDTRWLGSGIYTCGIETGAIREDGTPEVCGSTLRPAPYGGTAKSRHTTRKYLYRCTASAHLTVATTPTDEFVRDVVAERLRDPRVIVALSPADAGLEPDREKRAALSARLDGFERDYALGLVTGEQLRKATEAVSVEIEAIDKRMAHALRRTAAATILRATDPGQAFKDAELDIQRAVLAAVLRVEVTRAEKKGAAWTSARIKVTPAI